MGNLDDILLVRKQLEKLIENPDESADALTHIENLSKEKMTLKILQKSQIGFTLNSLRKASTDEKVQKSAKSLLKKWKELENSNGEAKPKKSNEKPLKVVCEKNPTADFEVTGPLPTRKSDNVLVFEDCPDFQPNLTPKEVLQLGSFGGTSVLSTPV